MDDGVARRFVDVTVWRLRDLGWHLGRIVWAAKLRGGPGHGIAFHDDDALNRGRNA